MARREAPPVCGTARTGTAAAGRRDELRRAFNLQVSFHSEGIVKSGKSIFKLSRSQWISVAVLASSLGLAAAVTIPNTFVPGATISAAQVNANFAATVQNKSVATCSAEVFNVALTATIADINSVSITVPGPGTVLVSGSGTFSVNNNGTAWEGDVWIADTSGGSAGDIRNFWGGPLGLPTGVYNSPVHEQRTFTVAAAGTNTYYMTGRFFNTQAVSVFRSNVCAVFTPT